MATHLSQDPTVEPDVTQKLKLRAAATFLEEVARGEESLPDGLACARLLLDAVELHEAERGQG